MDEIKKLSALAYELRKDVVDMIVEGKGGHIGGDMSVMDILVSLYFKEMNISPENKDDENRDRFILSKGHSVEAYYAVLAAKGFFPKKEVMEQFSRFGTPYIGHPNNKLPGIEEIIVYTRLWETGNWQRALSGKGLCRLPSTNWIICVRWWTGTGCRYPEIRRM